MVKRLTSRYSYYFTLLVCFFLFLAQFAFIGCGKRGQPQYVAPFTLGVVDDLRVSSAPGIRYLSWSVLSVSTKASVNADIKWEVFEKSLPAGSDACLFCDNDWHLSRSFYRKDIKTKISTADLAKLTTEPAYSASNNQIYLPVNYADSQLVRAFKVRFVIGNNNSEFSNKVALLDLPLPPEVSGIELHPSAASVELSWPAPNVDEAWLDYLYFRVYRFDTTADQFVLLNHELIRDPAFVDVGLQDRKSYTYIVTAVYQINDNLVEGPVSKEVRIVSGDITPPPAVSGLLAFPFSGGIQVVWNAVEAADLAGYILYRHDLTSGREFAPVRLGRGTHEYFYNTPILNHKYSFAVSSSDNNVPPNISKQSAPIILEMK